MIALGLLREQDITSLNIEIIDILYCRVPENLIHQYLITDYQGTPWNSKLSINLNPKTWRLVSWI